ncbi:primosomal protein [Sanguibacter gelidistatuariae]|nr:primosomal protein [Sanguibacter gelidistatuariae]
MTVDPRAALDRFVAALEAHFAAVANRRGDEDSSVDDAYDVLADAFDVYDEALGNTYGEALPVVLADDEDDDDDDDDDEDDGQDEDDDDDAEERLGGIDEADLDGSDYDEDVDAVR